jgi:hypothetical protein
VPELEDTEQTVVQAFASGLGDPLDDAAKRLVAAKLELLKAHLLFWQNQPTPTAPPA